jgi:hypothetical protein
MRTTLYTEISYDSCPSDAVMRGNVRGEPAVSVL